MFNCKRLLDNKVCTSRELSDTEQTSKMTSKVIALFLCVTLITWMATDAQNWSAGEHLCSSLYKFSYLQHLFILLKHHLCHSFVTFLGNIPLPEIVKDRVYLFAAS